jgi:predicted TIM-barrel fold metal-dependent hydrolase
MHMIDIHTHAWPDALAPGAISTVGGQGHIGAHHDGTIAGLLGAMDRAGIDVSVVLPVATKPTQVTTINDWIAGTASERILPFGAMHPDFPDPVAEIARMRSLGLRGFKMHPEYQTFEPCEERMRAIYAAAIEHGMILLFHAGSDVAFDSVRGTPEQFCAMLDEWPDLTAVLAHMGGFRQWHAVTGRLAGRDVWFDTAYTLGHLPDDEFVALAREHGCHRILLGTDSPWTDAAAQLEHLRRLPFTGEELAGILGGNAERLLGL